MAIPGLVGPSRGKEEEEVLVKAERGKSIPEFHRTAYGVPQTVPGLLKRTANV